MRFEFFVALRYLKAKRRQAVISVITAISVLGVTAGVAALVVALAINNGFREELENRLLGATAHINLLRAAQDGIRNYDALGARLERLPHVVAAAPVLYEQVLISSRSRAQGVVLKGVDPEREVKVGDLLRRLKEGSLAGLRRSSVAAASPPLPGGDTSAGDGARATCLCVPSRQRKALVEHIHGDVRLVFADHQRWRDPDRAWTATQKQDAAFEGQLDDLVTFGRGEEYGGGWR